MCVPDKYWHLKQNFGHTCELSHYIDEQTWPLPNYFRCLCSLSYDNSAKKKKYTVKEKDLFVREDIFLHLKRTYIWTFLMKPIQQNVDLRTTWFAAVRSGDVNKVLLMLTSGTDIDTTNDDGQTAIINAVSRCHDTLLEALIYKGADINKKSLRGVAAIHLAAEHGFEQIAMKLIKHGCDINVRDTNGDTPLLVATRNGHLGVMQMLHSARADLDCTSIDGSTPLTVATEFEHVDMVKFLVKNGSKVNARRVDGRTALLLATEKRNCPIAEVLCRHSADVNAVGEFGFTPIFVATLNNDIPMTELFLRQGCDTEVKDIKGSTVLMSASFRGVLDAVRVLCGNHVTVNMQNALNGRTALHFAVIKDHIDVIRCLIDAKACPNVIDRTNRTPLNYAHSKRVKDYLTNQGAYLSQDSWYSSEDSAPNQSLRQSSIHSQRLSLNSLISCTSRFSKVTIGASSITNFETVVEAESNSNEKVYSHVKTTFTEAEPATVVLRHPKLGEAAKLEESEATMPPLQTEDLPRQRKTLEAVVVDRQRLSGYLQRCAQHYLDNHVAGVSRSTASNYLEVDQSRNGRINYINQNINIVIENATYVQTGDRSRVIVRDSHRESVITGYEEGTIRLFHRDAFNGES
ncbi:ankyrin repeat domain-containing protein 50-like isoform X1 [Biomphalaria glabrata]|uniref:Ankyrin repeat domain-containing protein 50-like isoform X1 n=1 Tax=Biomphalaria glabrata TaxID=6526 RepID=A0A9W2YQV1_BIOGL|nr:ankyrin repeat domain-containing protein 50-like isoform X1 [Biomphalaria glabrata]